MKKLLFIALAIMAIACTKEEENPQIKDEPSIKDETPYLSFEEGQNSTITLSPSGAPETISFTTNNPWIASSSEAWLTVSPISGNAGTHSIKLTAYANVDDELKKAIVTIQSQNLSQSFNITQDAVLDFNFAKALESRGYVQDSDKISPEFIENVTEINLSYCGLTSLQGIELFKSLESLSCYANDLTSLDVSKNTALEYLSCGYNEFTSLDVSKNTALRNLNCNSLDLTSLDVSNNTALEYLYCSDNNLTSLDVSKNTALRNLSCFDNKLTSLDISNNTALQSLYCSDNNLTSLDVSKNTALRNLSCSDNKLTSLDISNNTALEYLSCSANPGNGTTFIVYSWFDNNTIPDNFTTSWWWYNEERTYIDYRKVTE